jgi:hypothetical protein
VLRIYSVDASGTRRHSCSSTFPHCHRHCRVLSAPVPHPSSLRRTPVCSCSATLVAERPPHSPTPKFHPDLTILVGASHHGRSPSPDDSRHKHHWGLRCYRPPSTTIGRPSLVESSSLTPDPLLSRPCRHMPLLVRSRRP